jgi:phage terminase large subunit-like protein
MPLSFEPVPADEKLRELGIHVDERDYHYDYPALSKEILSLTHLQLKTELHRLMSKFAKQDMFFLGYFVLNLPLNHPFLIARCYEVQESCHFTVDLWSREHWKSSIITFLRTIFELINNPEERIGIFSYNRALAKGHLRRIKQELENNEKLKKLFPDVFYMNPPGQAPKWSEDEGLYVKRTKTYNEASVEAWGLIESMPVGKHFTRLVYDDVVTENTVSTPGQREKVDERFKLSQNLGARGGQKRVIGTRYAMGDVYGSLIDSKRWKQRIYPAEIDESGVAKRGGTPVYLDAKELDEKFENQGEYVYSSQMLQNPVAVSKQKLQEKWISWYSKKPDIKFNKYITIDPASSKKKGSDSTVMQVWGADSKKRLWLLYMIRDKMGLGEKWEAIKFLTDKYEVTDVGYEKYGMQADLEYFEEKMNDDSFFLNFIELGGTLSKEDRIKRLVPYFQKGRIILPRSNVYTTLDGKTVDLMVNFIEDEYKLFPLSKHDDMLDCTARIIDSKMGVVYPTYIGGQSSNRFNNDPLSVDYEVEEVSGSWMAL